MTIEFLLLDKVAKIVRDFLFEISLFPHFIRVSERKEKRK